MDWFAVMNKVILVISLVVVLLMTIKVLMLFSYKHRVKAEYPNRILSWYNNIEIYGSGHHRQVKVLNTANALTTSFWILLVVLGSLIYLSKSLLS